MLARSFLIPLFLIGILLLGFAILSYSNAPLATSIYLNAAIVCPPLCSTFTSTSGSVSTQTSSPILIANAYVQGQLTADNGVTVPFTTAVSSPFSLQSVFHYSSSIGASPSISTNGQLSYDVYNIPYSFQQVCTTFFSSQPQTCDPSIWGQYQAYAIYYVVSVTVTVSASLQGSATSFTIQQLTSSAEDLTLQEQGVAQVVMSNLADVTTALKQYNAPYGTYNIQINTLENLRIWTISYQGLAYAPFLYYENCINNGGYSPGPLHQPCNYVSLVYNQNASIAPAEVDGVTYGQTNTPTFYVAVPSQITIGTLTGSSQIMSIAILTAGGFTGQVQLSFSNIPDGLLVTAPTSVSLPAPPLQAQLTASPSLQLGNYTITTTVTGGGVTKSASTQINAVKYATPTFGGAITTLSAITDMDTYAPLAIIKVTGTLLSGNGGAVSNQVINLQILGTSTATSVVTASDGSYSTTLVAPTAEGTYTILAIFNGTPNWATSSAQVNFTVRQPTIQDYTAYIVFAFFILIALSLAFVYVRRNKASSSSILR